MKLSEYAVENFNRWDSTEKTRPVIVFDDEVGEILWTGQAQRLHGWLWSSAYNFLERRKADKHENTIILLVGKCSRRKKGTE